MIERRRAMTLVEILVVLAIIVLLAALVLAFWPKRENRAAIDAASNLQAQISAAKARALRENRPVGVRFLTSDNYKTFHALQLIDGGSVFAPVDPAILVNGPDAPFPMKWTVYLDLPPGIAILNPAQNTAHQVGVPLAGNVEVGDMLEIVEGQGGIHRIVAIDYATNTMTLAGTQDVNPDGTPFVRGIPHVNGAGSARLGSNYRYLRRPRPLMGEAPYELPRDIVIRGASGTVPTSLHIPVGVSGEYEILFSPAGLVLNAAAGKTVLWIDDVNGAATPQLLAIYSATGNCVAHPVGPAGDEFAYVKDGR